MNKDRPSANLKLLLQPKQLADYSEFLDGVDRSIRNITRPDEGIILAGDFNAKSTVWGSSTNDYRDLLWDTISKLGISSANISTTPTSISATRSLVIDVTFSRDTGVQEWRVSTASNHVVITVISFAMSGRPFQKTKPVISR